MIAAIILSAGKSERMGSPKALLKLGDRTFLERILDTVAASGIHHVVVVAGHHLKEIAAAFPALSLTFNPHYESGMSTSVRAGVAALPAGVTSAGVFLVDHPSIEPEVVTALMTSVTPGRIVLPVYGDRRGHPVFFSSELFAEILALRADEGLNVVVRRDLGRVIEVKVAAKSVLEDIDTPQQFEKLLREKN